MNAKAKVRLPVSSEKQLVTLMHGLGPEAGAQSHARAKATLGRELNFLILNVEAKDSVALRSALNAYLRWIDTVLKVTEVAEGFSGSFSD